MSQTIPATYRPFEVIHESEEPVAQLPLGLG